MSHIYGFVTLHILNHWISLQSYCFNWQVWHMQFIEKI